MSIEKEEHLNHIEKQELKDCEIIIDDGLRGFVAVGNALAKIRDEKLYRGHYKSFEQYVDLYIGDKIAFWPGWTAPRELLDRYDSPACIEDQYEN